jgi:hypothetical protein
LVSGRKGRSGRSRIRYLVDLVRLDVVVRQFPSIQKDIPSLRLANGVRLDLSMHTVVVELDQQAIRCGEAD